MKLYITCGPAAAMSVAGSQRASQFIGLIKEQLKGNYQLEECVFEPDGVGWTWNPGYEACDALVVIGFEEMLAPVSFEVRYCGLGKERKTPVPVIFLGCWQWNGTTHSRINHSKISIGLKLNRYCYLDLHTASSFKAVATMFKAFEKLGLPIPSWAYIV